MRRKYLALMLAVLVLMVACTGMVGSVAYGGHYAGISPPTASHRHSPGTNTYSDGLPVDNTLAGLFASVESRGFAAPYVSRARGLVYQNDNRNVILKFITDNPGSMLLDISKALGMNVGTLRYHLMILDVNHLIVAHNNGIRQIRYFANNGAYSEEQMAVISLLKREPTGKLLGALAGSGGMTCAGIAAGSGLSYSDVNRYLRELMAKGIVCRESPDGKKYRYVIAPALERYVSGRVGQ